MGNQDIGDAASNTIEHSGEYTTSGLRPGAAKIRAKALLMAILSNIAKQPGTLEFRTPFSSQSMEYS